MAFELHSQLSQDTLHVGTLALCRVLLMRDANYPWLILVPERASVSELYQLNLDDQQTLTREVSDLSQVLAEAFSAHKMNVATLGNMVPQLHIHLIVRYRDDAAWPKPVWGAVERKEYEENALKARMDELRALLQTMNTKPNAC